MKLLEHEGKELFRKHGISTPKFALLTSDTQVPELAYPLVLKSQVAVGDRKKKGGIVIVSNQKELDIQLKKLFALSIDAQIPKEILAEELVKFKDELYVSLSYSSDFRSPVLSLNKQGGSGVSSAQITPIDILSGVNDTFIDHALRQAKIEPSKKLRETIAALWKLFYDEQLTLAEINPLFITQDGSVVAGDAKLVRDEATLPPGDKESIALGGDIAVIASGGGASMLNIDILMRAGGKPANYIEYSGNPPAALVEELTMRVLGVPSLKGLWVVGGTANFTDTYETMSGFAAGLKKISPKVTYPVVIRRDGPRQTEAKAMLEKFAKDEGFAIEVYGSELSMSASAERLVELMKKK